MHLHIWRDRTDRFEALLPGLLCIVVGVFFGSRWLVDDELLGIGVSVSVWWHDAAVFLHLLEHFGDCCLANAECSCDEW